MQQIVCESLQEYRVLTEAKDSEKHGAVSGIWRAVKTAPGRALRRSRARSIMKKYENKIKGKLQKILDKYKPNIKNLIKRTEESINNINTSPSNIRSLQKEALLDDMVDSMKAILTSIKEAMQEQLKVYAESLNSRLERAGTITGVEFLPEDKTTLISEWKIVETEINKQIQNHLIDLISDPDISKFSKIKATLKDYINRNIRSYNYDFGADDKESDESTLSSEEKKLWTMITNRKIHNDNIEFDRPYPIDSYEWKHLKIGPLYANKIEFKIDSNKGKVGYAFYEFSARRGRTVRKYPDIFYLIGPNENLKDGENKFKKIELTLK